MSSRRTRVNPARLQQASLAELVGRLRCSLLHMEQIAGDGDELKALLDKLSGVFGGTADIRGNPAGAANTLAQRLHEFVPLGTGRPGQR